MKKVLIIISANLLILLSIAVIIELMARWQLDRQTRARPPLYLADPILGFRLKPNFDTLYQSPQFESPIIPIHISSQGFREDKTYAIPKAPQTFRILMLGDSFTQGDEVPLVQTFSKILEMKLNSQKDGITYEVINAGVRGSGPLQQYLWLKTEGLKFNPDLVILNFYLGNDITDALMFNIDTDDQGLAQKLTLKDTYVDNQGYLNRRQTHFSLCELSSFCRLYLRPQPKTSNWDNQAWQITQRHLLAINQLTQLVLTLIPPADLTHDQARQVLIDFAQANQIKLIDFSPALKPDNYDSFDHHWNRTGHQIAAQLLYEYLLPL